mgnify:CR=1 FL=1
MEDKRFNYNKLKKIYLKFLTSQEVMSEPFRDKLGQLNKFYLPISKMIAKEYLKTKKTKVILPVHMLGVPAEMDMLLIPNFNSDQGIAQH